MTIFSYEISTMNLVLWGCVIWMPAFYYVILSNETKFKKNISLGVTLPQEAREDETVLNILNTFKKQLLWACIAITLLAIPGVFISKIGTAMTLWMIWLLLGIVVPYIPYVRSHRQLKQLKIDRGWAPSNPSVRVADLSGIAFNTKWLSPWVFIVPAALSLIPMLFDKEMKIAYLIYAATVALFWFCYRYLYRNKAEVVDDNMAVAEALTRIRRRNWGRLWIISAWFMVLLDFLIWLTSNNEMITLFGALLLSIFMVAACLYFEMSTRRLQETITEQSGGDFYVDEDDKWIWGMFYYNPNDSRLIINNRTGMNTTINLAKRSGQLIMAATALMLLCLPLFGVWMDNMESTPVGLEINDTAIISTHTGVEYELTLDSITYAEYVAEKPKLKRSMGTGMDTVLKGRFGTPWGSASICVDPRTLPYIYLETDDDKRYLFGSSDSVETEAVYQVLMQTIANT